MTVDVSVLIVSFNARELLDDCLESIRTGSPPSLEVETIVVDNASTDGSAAWVRDNHRWVTTIEAPENGGFAAGNNLAMQHATGRFLLLLNSDARLQGDVLERLVGYLDAHPDVGQVGPT